MLVLAQATVALVALLHVYFLALEMFFWQKPLGLKTFRNSPEKARDSAVLAANQGLYNGFLAAGLAWGLAYPDAAIARSRACCSGPSGRWKRTRLAALACWRRVARGLRSSS